MSIVDAGRGSKSSDLPSASLVCIRRCMCVPRRVMYVHFYLAPDPPVVREASHALSRVSPLLCNSWVHGLRVTPSRISPAC